MTKRQRLRHPVNIAHHERASLGERLADGAARQIGSWRFLIFQTVAVAVWMALNVTALISHWDPYPWVLLNLLFSVQAAYTGPVLLLSGNRQAAKDRAMAEHDVEINELAEKRVEEILQELLRNSEATLRNTDAALRIAGHLGVPLGEEQ